MKISIALLCSTKLVEALISFDFVARHYYPAGYAEGTTEGVPDL